MSSSKTSPDDFFLSRKRLFRTRILNPFFPFLSQSIVSVCGNFFHSSSLYPSRSIVFCMNSSNSVFYFDVWQMCLLVYFICHSVVMLTISSEQTKGTQKKTLTCMQRLSVCTTEMKFDPSENPITTSRMCFCLLMSCLQYFLVNTLQCIKGIHTANITHDTALTPLIN